MLLVNELTFLTYSLYSLSSLFSSYSLCSSSPSSPSTPPPLILYSLCSFRSLPSDYRFLRAEENEYLGRQVSYRKSSGRWLSRWVRLSREYFVIIAVYTFESNPNGLVSYFFYHNFLLYCDRFDIAKSLLFKWRIGILDISKRVVTLAATIDNIKINIDMILIYDYNIVGITTIIWE